jgi:hypothetical protein
VSNFRILAGFDVAPLTARSESPPKGGSARCLFALAPIGSETERLLRCLWRLKANALQFEHAGLSS